MARIFEAMENDESIVNLSGGILLLCQLFIAISIISMIIFGCVDGANNDNENKEKKENEKDKPPPNQVTIGCCDGGCCSTGDGGDGGGCGGCGGD